MLWDTSAIIDYLRGDPVAARHFKQVIEGIDRGVCSTISVAELFAGTRNNQERIALAATLSLFESFPVDDAIAQTAGGLLRGRSRPEIKAHFGDALIAATAISSGETILTADRRSERTFGSHADYRVYD